VTVAFGGDGAQFIKKYNYQINTLRSEVFCSFSQKLINKFIPKNEMRKTVTDTELSTVTELTIYRLKKRQKRS